LVRLKGAVFIIALCKKNLKTYKFPFGDVESHTKQAIPCGSIALAFTLPQKWTAGIVTEPIW
jgi:hypothetical protein